jgi:plastocyanin
MPKLPTDQPSRLAQLLVFGIFVTGCGGDGGNGGGTEPPDVGPAAVLAKAGGDNQSGEINTQLSAAVQARVTDADGDLVAGTGVNWSATGASVSAPTVASNSSGISEVTVTLGGTAGPITIVAEASGLTGSPLTFNATAVAPTPAPTAVTVTVQNDNFTSNRNATISPAVDTVAVGGTVTWTWTAQATNTHNVTSSGSPSFPSSTTQTQPFTYGPITFATAGTYVYFCTIHGSPTAGMRGRIVVR